MLVKQGKLDANGHPYVEIRVSAEDTEGSGATFEALIDTGFTGFVSLPIIAATTLKLQPHTTARYELANGKLCDPIPLARAFACVDGDKFVAGVVSISEHARVLVGVEFLRTCGKSLIFSSDSVGIIDDGEFKKLAEKEAANQKAKGSAS
jgi:predicted aspartyl protease